MNLMNMQENNQTMTSRELHKIVYDATGKFNELKSFHRKCKDVLANFDGASLKPSKDSRGYVDFYNLNEVQCNMIMASIDINHLQLVSEVFVKVKNNEPLKQEVAILNNKLAISNLETAKAFGFKGNQALLSADKATKALTGYSPLTLMGHTHLMNEKQEQSFTPTELGKICEPNISAIKMNKILSESGLQTKIDKKWFVTDKGTDYAQVLDTGKQHSDGTPIQQIKWYESVVDAI